MTLLEIQMLIHYAVYTTDYRDGDFSASAVRDAIDSFRDNLDLLENMDGGVRCYNLTDRGRLFVEALKKVPLPEQVWVMPEKSE